MEKKDQAKENLHKDHRKRMRERYMECGFSGFQEHEILEFILFYAQRQKNTNPIAHRLLNQFKSLDRVMDADIEDLKKIPGVSDGTAIFLKMIPELFSIYQLSKEKKEQDCMNASQMEMIKKHLQSLYIGRVGEHISIMHLDRSMNIIQEDFLSEGSISFVALNIRQIAEMALQSQASMIILSHNHPGASSAPSKDDFYVTQQLYNALRYLGILLQDHYILGKDGVLSLREYGFWSTLE